MLGLHQIELTISSHPSNKWPRRHTARLAQSVERETLTEFSEISRLWVRPPRRAQFPSIVGQILFCPLNKNPPFSSLFSPLFFLQRDHTMRGICVSQLRTKPSMSVRLARGTETAGVYGTPG